MKALHSDKFKIPKEAEKDFKRQKDTAHSCTEVSIVKMTILSKAVYRFNPTPVKIPMQLFILLKKLKLCMKTQITNDIKIILNNKKFWRYQHLRLQVIPQNIVIKITYWYKHLLTDQ